MNRTQEPVQPSLLLQSEGWHASVDARLLRASEPWEEAPEFRSHGHVLRRLFADSEPEDLAIDAVLCVDGRPTVCIKDARALSSPEIEDFRRRVWNLGAATLLVVETQRDVQVFSTMAKPRQKDREGTAAQLSNETITNMETAALALRLSQLVRRVETGAIYREYKPFFNPQNSVNRQLLENLSSLRNLVVRGKSKRAYQRAHAFIGRFLFSCYLLDRGIVGPPYLRKINLPEANDMLELLKETVDAPQALDILFTSLQRDFNGSLLGDLVDDYDIRNDEVIYLRRFLSGENLRTGQLSLFKLYDFSFIPIELISSIYEDFLGTEAEAETQTNLISRSRAHGQRSRGSYYTPPRLAELAVDIATEGWATLLDKRCLDPACGSGVFLVILFIRMAEEWRKRNPNARTRTRYEALLRLLSENLCGIDIHITACVVSCFSLYLAFLDQMKPKEITELREALKHERNQKLLPRILWEHDKARPRPPSFPVVRETDFFEYDPQEEFNLVIGNPPWVSRKAAPSIEEWLFSSTENPRFDAIKASERRQTLFPAREWACAFMWKTSLHLAPDGRVCQVLPSRVFLSNNTDRFQSSWLQTHKLESVWLLADWSFVLFPNADCPCFISRYRPLSDREALGTFDFITPKVELLDPREATIPVLPEDRKVLSQSALVVAAGHGQAAAEWKRRHWGTLRDVRLIDRLMQFPRLKRLARRPPRNPASITADRKRHWLKGQGFRSATESTLKPKKIFWKETDRFLSAEAHVLNLILLEESCPPIEDQYKAEGLDRERSPLIYQPPLVLINKACTKFLFSNFYVLFKDDFLSISAPQHEEDELLFLTAVLSSPLTQYLLFHTTANIGIERDIARTEEILEMPFPLPEDMSNPEHSELVMRDCARLLRNLHTELRKPGNLLRRESLVHDAKNDLYESVCDYFEISDWERQLIEDTVKIFRRSSTPGSLYSDSLITSQISKAVHRRQYAETLTKTFRGWTRSGKHLWADCAVADKLGLALITFGVGEKAKQYAESPAEDRVANLLETISDAGPTEQMTTFHHLRGFAYYEPDRVHILKPLTRRHWTRTAALNDADEILARMMEESAWLA